MTCDTNFIIAEHEPRVISIVWYAVRTKILTSLKNEGGALLGLPFVTFY